MMVGVKDFNNLKVNELQAAIFRYCNPALGSALDDFIFCLIIVAYYGKFL